MTHVWRCARRVWSSRSFSSSSIRREIRDIAELSPRLHPQYEETSSHELLALKWPAPPRNILIVRKDNDAQVEEALISFTKHIHEEYPNIRIICEPRAAEALHETLPFPIYTVGTDGPPAYDTKADLTATFGGDGTILRAASLFAAAQSVPPILSFSMGTLGFLGEWKYPEYKRAFREVYMSGAPLSMLDPKTFESKSTSAASSSSSSSESSAAWDHVRGKALGASRTSRILLRNRLRVGLFDADGTRLPHEKPPTLSVNPAEQQQQAPPPHHFDIFALNEVLIHRGASPHLAHITISIGAGRNKRTLTTAIADGVLVSTPTGSTAYSLSSGGAIVHPLVESILLTPICPRSLSFRPLVLPADSPVTLTLAPANRGEGALEVSVDGVRRRDRLRVGMEVRVVGEAVRSDGAKGARDWLRGGVPCVVRSGGSAADGGEDHWVGGLNSLLKFNYPFGEEA